VIYIKGDEINKNKCILNFINDIREAFIGDIAKKEKNQTKPIQLMPILNNYKDIKKIRKSSGLSIGDKVLEYLNEISIYINNNCNQKCDICNDAFKQIKFCTKNIRKNEIDINLLKNTLKGLSNGNISVINILGGNIFSYSKLNQLLDVLKNIKAAKNIYIHYLNLFEHIEEIENFSNTNIKILVSSYIDKVKISKIENYSNKTKIKKEYIFAVSGENDFNKFQEVISELDLVNYSFHPVYNDQNIDFFKENIFIDSNDLKDVKLSMKNIFAKNSMNTNNFGKLIIKENGKIYSNLNGKSLGQLGIDTIKDVIYKELKNYYSYWLKSRVNVTPCKDCLNNFLCPPLSNYEYTMKRNNLCDVIE
jgi:pseudo-rSAM protein